LPTATYVALLLQNKHCTCIFCTVPARALSDVLVNQQVFRHLLLWQLELKQDCSLSLDELSMQYLTNKLPPQVQQHPQGQLLSVLVQQQQQQQQQQGEEPLPGQQPQKQLLQQQQQARPDAAQQRLKPAQDTLPVAQQQQQPKPGAPPRSAILRPASRRLTAVQARLLQAQAAAQQASLPDSQASKQTGRQPQPQQDALATCYSEPALQTSPQQQQQQQQLLLPQAHPMEMLPNLNRPKSKLAKELAEWELQLYSQQQRLEAFRTDIARIPITDPSAPGKFAAYAEETKAFQLQLATLRHQQAEAAAAAEALEARASEEAVLFEADVVFELHQDSSS
jgi:hypothetical protein